MPASRNRQAAVFDVVGTLIDLTPARDELVSIGAPPLALEAWFQRLLHSAATTSAIGRLRPFEELARASLRSTLAQLGLDPDSGDEVTATLGRLPAYPDAAEALDLLRDQGHAVVALTNSGSAQARSLRSLLHSAWRHGPSLPTGSTCQRSICGAGLDLARALVTSCGVRATPIRPSWFCIRP